MTINNRVISTATSKNGCLALLHPGRADIFQRSHDYSHKSHGGDHMMWGGGVRVQESGVVSCTCVFVVFWCCFVWVYICGFVRFIIVRFLRWSYQGEVIVLSRWLLFTLPELVVALEMLNQVWYITEIWGGGEK